MLFGGLCLACGGLGRDPAREASVTPVTRDDGVTVLADGFYATEKSIDAFADGVGSIDMDALVDRIMTDGVKTIWH